MQFCLYFLLHWLTLSLANETSLEEFISGNNLFTTSLYKQITTKEKSNFLVSPLSVEIVLSLTQLGAKGATAEEVRTALHLPNSQEKIEDAVKTLQPILAKTDLYTIQSANKIYIKNNFEIKDEFKKSATVFDSAFETIDFVQKDAATDTMNGWVEGRTNHKIKNLIKPEDLSNDTRAILINALYFKGNWSIPFQAISKRDFYRAGVEKIQVDTMHAVMSQNYYESQELDAKFLELPFEGGEVTLTVVLPNERNGLAVLEAQLEKIFQNPSYTTENVRIALPKFKVESEIDLKGILQELGVNLIFREGQADLSGIAGNKGELFVDKVRQKTFIDVSETGVEAAGATFVEIVNRIVGTNYKKASKEFIADHPFFFYIKLKNLVIFAGRVVDASL
ncbi:hypothetical protein Zmor_022330 [Zophobas morio]|uniref:Serpin domain-containing protein n=1 Tax=Zophobas morio TaxID=2755281 RepID=A0AA38HVZ3_9CUCU|nr:hypothetical protein Zmor_022330 [Zophobas morio]